VPLYFVYIDPPTEDAVFYYRFIDINDFDKAMYGYKELLINNGFEYTTMLTDESGFETYIYTNNESDLEVYFGADIFYGATCMYVMIIHL
jgi:hypothetical protein